jgi:uncharacterized protein
MTTEFVWNTAKAASNERKHSVNFNLVARAFSDPYRFTELQDFVDGVPRWQTMAMFEGILLLFVVHTDWEEDGTEIIRIISAREATSRERRQYEQNRYENRS